MAVSQSAKEAAHGGDAMSPLQRIKAILGGSAGNLVEWYDWFAYSSTSLYFAAHFFPKGDAVAQQLQEPVGGGQAGGPAADDRHADLDALVLGIEFALDELLHRVHRRRSY